MSGSRDRISRSQPGPPWRSSGGSLNTLLIADGRTTLGLSLRYAVHKCSGVELAVTQNTAMEDTPNVNSEQAGVEPGARSFTPAGPALPSPKSVT